MSEWQDISTAPKDGTMVLIAAEYDATVAEWSKTYGWQLSYAGSWAEDADVPFEPTHWSPIPALPAKPTTGE